MKRTLVTLALWVLVAMPALAADSDFRGAAEAWLSLVDQKQYAESWNKASDYFKAAVTAATWEQSLKGVREPLGAMGSRTMDKATAAKSLPGAPDGDYQVLIFKSSFANKAEAVETVTMKQEGGTWKAAGYFIK